MLFYRSLEFVHLSISEDIKWIILLSCRLQLGKPFSTISNWDSISFILLVLLAIENRLVQLKLN